MRSVIQVVCLTLFLLVGFIIYVVLYLNIDISKLIKEMGSENSVPEQKEYYENTETQKNDFPTTTQKNIEQTKTLESNTVIEAENPKNEPVQNKVLKPNPTTTETNTKTQDKLEPKTSIIVPEVAIGYVWSSDEGSPKFKSVMIPIYSLQKEYLDDLYLIEIWDGDKFVSFKSTPVLTEVTFPEGGVSKFRVTGLSPDLSICPGARGYTWAIKFVSEGTFKGDMLPITQDVSAQGKTCHIVY